MDRKEIMDGYNKLSEFSAGSKNMATSSPRKWEEGRNSSASELFESLSQGPRSRRGQHEVHRELTSSEFLEFLRKQQGPEEEVHEFTMAADIGKYGGKSHNTHSSKDRKQERYESAAIDQCDITSSVDYGSRDYYQISKHTSIDTPYVAKENEWGDLYDADTRGNWWQGSLYY